MAKKYVCLADIESIRVPYSTFNAALKELSKFGEIVSCSFTVTAESVPEITPSLSKKTATKPWRL